MENHVYELTVPANISIGDFKKELEKKCQIPADRQRLISKAKLLVDDKLLSDYIEEDDQFVHLLKNTGANEAG